MLPAAQRLTDRGGYRRAIRTGRRSGARTVVVHLGEDLPGTPARIGFVVNKAVGNAVSRNRVKRRLRHLSREHLASLPGSTVLVVRALPPAAEASYQELGADLARCLQRVTS